MPPATFAIMYFSIFLGYVMSPVHPCVSVTIEYFKVTLKEFLKPLTLPAIIGLIVTFITAILFL